MTTADSPERDETIIVAEHLCRTFPGPVVALDDLSVRVRRGEVLVVIGPSGSGKSTLLRCLTGLEQIDSGTIVIDGIPVDGLAPYELTTLFQPATDKGRAAGAAVAAMLEGRVPASVLLTSTFRPGNTTAPPTAL